MPQDLDGPGAENQNSADAGGESGALFDELQKVRTSLRGNLVPEARTLAPDRLEDVLRAPLIWILISGGVHEHLAFAALGGALQKAGYRVKVFGVGRFANIFQRVVLPFEANDERPTLHRNNAKARSFLERNADNSGIPEGPDKAKDWLFEVYALRQEFTARTAVNLALEGNPAGFAAVTLEHEQRFNDFFIRSDCSDEWLGYMSARFVDVVSWRASDRRVSFDNFVPIRRARCLAFREFIRQLAKDAGEDYIDVLEALRHEFTRRLVPLIAQAAGEGRETAPVLRREIEDYLSWHAGESPREWWQRWEKKMPGWREAATRIKGEQSMMASVMHNMLLTMDGLEPGERPRLLLYRVELSSVALALEAQYQIETAMAWPWLLPPHRLDHLMLWKALVEQEERDPVPFRPLRDMGPRAFSNLLWSNRQIAGMAPMRLRDEMIGLELRSSPLELQNLREAATGLWLVDSEPLLLPSDDPLFFSEPGDRERLHAFLAECSSPPICLGWGKRPHPRGPEALAALVCKTVQLLDRRAVFLTGSSGASAQVLRSMQESRKGNTDFQFMAAYAQRHILFLERAPHNWLFPKCACVVSHGGMATVQSALRAAVPQVLLFPERRPEHGKHNGDYLKLLGCGVEHLLPMAETTPKQLADTVRAVIGSEEMKAKAVAASKAVLKCPGALGGVAVVANMLLPRPRPRLPPPPEAPPWLDGVWPIYLNGAKLIPNVVRGYGFYDMEGRQIGWMQTGSFRWEVRTGLPEGHTTYTVQAFWPVANKVAYGTVTEDGKRITWDDGNYHQWDGPLKPDQAEEDESVLAAFPPLKFLGGIVDRLST